MVAALVGFGTKAGPGADARLAAACPPRRAELRLGPDVGGDDQGRPLRADPRALRVGRPGAACGRADGARAGPAVGAGRRALRAGAARPEAAAGLPLDRERRDRRARPRRLDPLRLSRRGDLGGDRLRGGAPPRPQPRGVQGAAVPGGGSLRARGGLARPRPPRRAAAAHAVDRRGLSGRGDGDRRGAAAQRLRLGVARPCRRWSTSPWARPSASASPAPSQPPVSPRRRPWPCSASSRRSGWSCSARPAGPRPRRRSRRRPASGSARCFSPAAVSCWAPSPACSSPR